MPSFSDARALSERMLAEHLPERWQRVQSVAREAIRIADIDGVDRDALIRSAVLHDIGCSPVVARGGFPPLDGARFLSRCGYDDRIAALVAHQSGAAAEAEVRGYDGLAAFEDEDSPTRDALWYCDAVTGPTGERRSPEEHWAEIRQHSGPSGVVTRVLDLTEPGLRAALERTRARMDQAGLPRTT